MNKAVNEEDLIQLITGECSPAQRERVEKWLEENSENRERLRKLRKTWEISGNLKLRQNEEEVWNKISRRISNPSHLTIHRSENKDNNGEKKEGGTDYKSIHPGYKSSKYSKSWFSSIAIACLLLIGSLYLFYEYGYLDEHSPVKEAALQQVTAGRGERMNLTLSDGTSVVLNSSSTIRYPSLFSGQSREIELEGEAFFSIARNVDKPFLVHAGDAVIRVLGTKFNVNAYADSDGVEVVVEEGEVAVRSDSLANSSRQQGEISNEVTLIAGEYTIVKEGKAPVSPITVALDHHLGWINGDLIFEATPLDVVIKKLERYYNRDFEVTDSSLLDHKLTVSFKKESLSKVLNVLSVAMDIRYEQRDSLIYLESYE